ncbi:MAG: hypothetical protein IPH97_01845 [Ignavibacteriales bacterium]|nr:hypothetical protein [Ignavibacteriales bacterium]
MKAFNKVGLHILFWIAIPLIVLYFKWAAQDTTTLPGISVESESFLEVVKTNIDVIVVSLLGSVPAFYWSLFCLTPKLLFKTNYIKITLYTLGLAIYYLIVSLITELIFPMYFFFGTPYAIKVLAPIILLSALSGTLFAFKEKLQSKNL